MSTVASSVAGYSKIKLEYDQFWGRGVLDSHYTNIVLIV